MRKIIDGVKSHYDAIFERRVSPVPLGIFRIIYGLSVLIEIVNLFYFRHLFFDPAPFLEPYAYPIGLFLMVWALSVLLLTIGYKVKISAAGNFIFCVLFLGFGSSVFSYEWHADSLILSGAMLLLFMPTDRALSLQLLLERKSGALQSKPTVRYIYPVLLMLLIGGIYLDSIFWKATSDMYLSGLGLWAPASLPFNVYWDMQWLLDLKYLIYIASYTVLCYEFIFIFLVWFKYWRILLITLGVIFHIAIGVAFPLPAFGLIMVGFLMGCMPTDVYATIYKYVTGKEFKIHYATDELSAEQTDSKIYCEKISKRYISHSVKKKIVAAYLCFWFLSLLIIHFRSPFYLTYVGDKDSFWGSAYKLGAIYKAKIYPLTGFSTHGLYVDNHFRDYTYEIKLVYLRKGEKVTIPVIRNNGMAGMYDVGRNHIYWTFRTAWPLVSQELMEKRMKRFILFWLGKNGVNMNDAVVNIYTKSLTVSLKEFSKGRLHKNISNPWKLAGKFIAKDSEFSYKWLKELPKSSIPNK